MINNQAQRKRKHLKPIRDNLLSRFNKNRKHKRTFQRVKATHQVIGWSKKPMKIKTNLQKINKIFLISIIKKIKI